jgi:sugar lactone lactonase YvrE
MIDLDTIKQLGEQLNRPECVLSTANGRVYVSDWRGGVTIVEPDGSQWSLLANDSESGISPNGITLLADGSLLLCHLGDEQGGVFRLHEDGAISPFLLEVDGNPLPPTNYAHLDHAGRVWVTVSTRMVPRARGYTPFHADGFIVLVDENGARIVADNLGYTNECIVHPDGNRLFVNETFARKLTSFEIAENGDLSDATTVAEFGPGTFPDGLVFDAEGGIWITSIVSNRVIRISPEGDQEIIVEDSDPQHLEWVEAAFQSSTMGRSHLDNAKSQLLRNISSLAFGGTDLKTAYLGCLLDNSIYKFQSPFAGSPPAHWNFAGPQKQS